jgi:hypothetical protein
MPRRPLTAEQHIYVLLDARLSVLAKLVHSGLVEEGVAVDELAGIAAERPAVVGEVEATLWPSVPDWPPLDIQRRLLAAVRERLNGEAT